MGMEKRNLQRISRILSFYDVIPLEKVFLNREGKMIKISRLSFSGIVFLFCFFLSFAVVSAGDAVLFSGIVKKVLPNKNKVGIKDPDTKKRFTVIVNEKTKPDGLKILGALKKKDKVEGKYTVTDAGLYIALELIKK
jgi:hypothetical protein